MEMKHRHRMGYKLSAYVYMYVIARAGRRNELKEVKQNLLDGGTFKQSFYVFMHLIMEFLEKGYEMSKKRRRRRRRKIERERARE